MKVLMINSVCGIGSTGRICTDIAEVLEAQSHECKIAYGRGIAPEKYKKFAVKMNTEFNVKIDGIKTRIFDNAGFNNAGATKKFINWIKEYNPDVIHLHNIHGYYINVKLLFDYLKTCKKKIIWTLHDCWSFTGHCAHFDFVGCDKWKNQCLKCEQKKTYPKSCIFDKSARNYKLKKECFTNIPNLTIVTPSNWLANLVRHSFLKDYPVLVINNGIDLAVFKPTVNDFRDKNNLVNKKIILGVANVWNEKKGFNDFIKLSKLISEDYRIVLVGLNQKQLKLLPKNILGICRTNSVKELAEIYSTADVFVNFTYEDNFPTVNLEAQACGTPIITYKTGGSVESAKTSNCFDKGDIEFVFKHIEVLLNSNDTKADCISQAQKYNKIDKYNEYIKVYCNKV